MKLRQEEAGGRAILTIREIEPFFLDLLRRLPASADPADDAAARERLFSAPISPLNDEDNFTADWRNFVQPDLRDLFRSAQEIVAGDLAALPPAPGAASPETEEGQSTTPMDVTDFEPTGHYLEIPTQHADAWLSVLNQARLVIAAKQGFGDEAMEEELPLPPFNEREYGLFQVHFYDYLQQALLQAMGYD